MLEEENNMATYVSLNRQQVLVNDLYNVTWSVRQGSITQTLTNAIAAFSEPAVAIATSYTPGSPAPVFTVPAQTYRLISDLPITFSFDPTNPALSATYIQDQVTYFISQFEAQYISTVNTLIDQMDTYSGEFILNVT